MFNKKSIFISIFLYLFCSLFFIEVNAENCWVKLQDEKHGITCNGTWDGNVCKYTTRQNDLFFISEIKSNGEGFKGWYRDASCKSQYKITETSLQTYCYNLFYACYEKEEVETPKEETPKEETPKVETPKEDQKKYYTINLNGNGTARFSCPQGFNTITGNSSSGACKATLLANTKFVLPKVDERHFAGWSKDKCNTIISGGVTVSATSSITYTVCYKPIITLDGNGTARFSCPQGFNTATNSASGRCEGILSTNTKFTLPKVDEPHFAGWSKDNCKTIINNEEIQTAKINTVYKVCYKSSSSNNSTNETDSITSINAVRWVGVDISKYNLICGEPIYIKNCYTNGEKICDFTSVNNTNTIIGQVIANDLRKDYKNSSCKMKGPMYSISNGVLSDGKTSYKCGEELYITSCNNSLCYIGGLRGETNPEKYYGTIDISLLKDNVIKTKDYCDNNKEDDSIYSNESHEVDIYNDVENNYNENINDSIDKTVEIKKCNNEKKINQRSSSLYNLCFSIDTQFKDFESIIRENYVCDENNGYKFDSTYFNPLKDEECDSKTGYCTRTFEVSCIKESTKIKPIIEGTSGTVNHEGVGTIVVKATAIQGEIVGYYFSENKKTPTHTDRGWIRLDDDNFTIQHAAGTIYIWVKDSYGQISNSIKTTINDTSNTNTTVKELVFKDSNNKIIELKSTLAYNDKIISNKYVMMSNNLRKDSKLLSNAFNPYDMEYEIEVDSPTVTVYATLTSNDSNFVEGYAPRTVNLDYGLNTVLIKIQDKEGKIRTYTVLVTRKDNRTSDNTLRDIKLSVGELEFNSNVTDYKIEIPNNTTSVNVDSIITSDKASYVSGYEPGIVEIIGSTTVKLIKVKSETGSVRTYILTFVKKGTDIITDESLMIEYLSIPGVYIPFEENIANYSISVNYETSFIDIKTLLKDKNSIIKFKSKRTSENEFVEGSTSGVLLDVGENFIEIIVKNKDGKTSTYRITIIRKEMGLEISDDVNLKDLRVLGYDIKFKPEKKEYKVKIKQEKSLVITAVPNSNRAEVFIRGNEELTGFSTVRIKVVAENGEYETYSIDIKKDAFNKVIEISAIVIGIAVILGGSAFKIIKKKSKSQKEYFEE